MAQQRSLDVNGCMARSPIEQCSCVLFLKSDATVGAKPTRDVCFESANGGKSRPMILVNCFSIMRKKQRVVHFYMIFVADVIPIFPKDFESTFVSGMIRVAGDAIKTEYQFFVIECL